MSEKYCDYRRCKNYKMRYSNLCRVHTSMINKTKTKYYSYFFMFNIALVLLCTYIFINQKHNNIKNLVFFKDDVYDQFRKNLVFLKDDIYKHFRENLTCENLEEYKRMVFNMYNSVLSGFQYMEYPQNFYT